MSAVTAPAAPGKLGEPVQPQAMVGYLAELDAWLAARRAELAAIDAEILGRRLDALTSDLQLSLALWQAVKSRNDLLLITSEVHQMFGRYTGQVRTDEGETIRIDGLVGFAEEHHARW